MRSFLRRVSWKLIVLVSGVVVAACVFAANQMKADGSAITASNWGRVTAPVFGTQESGAYSGAELFAGPSKLGDGNYYSGVLPNGRIVKPAGISIQIGMNPLGAALTPDGKFLVTTNDDEREGGLKSLQNTANQAAYSVSVIDTASMTVVSQINTAGKLFVGLVVTGASPSYTAWVSGGGDNRVKTFNIDQNGNITAGVSIAIAPTLPSNQGYVSNYTPSAALNTPDGSGNKPPVPSGFSRTGSTKITFPAGMTLSPDGSYLYVACNGDNSVAVINTASMTVVKQAPAGYFPYGVVTSRYGDKVFVSNWGVTAYQFANPTYDTVSGKLTAVGTTGNTPFGFFVPVTNTAQPNPSTSSISVLNAPQGNGASLTLLGSLYQGHPLDDQYNIGDTHPSAIAVVHNESLDVIYVAKTNSDRLAILKLHNSDEQKQAKVTSGAFTSNSDSNGLVQEADFDLSPIGLTLADGHSVHGAYPNAMVVSPDNQRLYVAEAGLNSVAVLDVSSPFHPALLGRIPTGWYPTGLALSPDGNTLYIVNAKGIGEDINPNANPTSVTPPATGLASFAGVDSNYIFGSAQKVDLTSWTLDNTTVLANNFALHDPVDTNVVPVGGAASSKIKHVFFILHENKTFDSMLGNLGTHFGNFASTNFNNFDGSPAASNLQYTGVSLNTQTLAQTFATAVNYYSDSEESDAGHQFAASGTASDYTEKTLLVKTGRGLLVNKNFEPEDYPEGGYIFNNAARHGVSFKDYGALVRIEGTDTGTSTPTKLNDPLSGTAGFPQMADPAHVITPIQNVGDVTTATQGLGQSYFLNLPILSILGENNASGEPHLDVNYPGYNFNISDQRRALEFIKDFDRMVASGTLPQFLYIYEPNDHTGGLNDTTGVQTICPPPNGSCFPIQEVADGDVGLGMVVNHIMSSPIYYNAQTGEGSAIFITYDDAQSTLDHIHPHRTPLIVVSPYAKPGYAGTKHYVTASVVKTEELLLGLPPNNLGDLFATDLRDLFQSTYNGITSVSVTKSALNYKPSPEGKKIWALARNLDLSGPDRDSARLGALSRLCLRADELHRDAAKAHKLETASYKSTQASLYAAAWKLVHTGAPRDMDD